MWTLIVLVVLAVVLWGFYISWRASRLDRLHNRTEAARTALDLAMVRRSSAAYELASSGLLDPATSLLLADAVCRAKDADPAERDLAESDLTRALRAAFDQPGFRGTPGVHRPQVLQRRRRAHDLCQAAPPGPRLPPGRDRPAAGVLRDGRRTHRRLTGGGSHTM